MFPNRWTLIALAVVFGTVARAEAGDNQIPPKALAILEKADKLELFSLKPEKGQKPKNGFRGRKVLGKTLVKKARDRKALVAALKKGVKDSDGSVAGCFNPRHGIRVTHKGKTAEFVICFECLSMMIYVDGKQVKGCLTTGSPEATFDKVLAAAKVPLAPKKE
jgi:hypothetical protein